MAGNLNSNLVEPEGTQQVEAMTEDLTAAGLEDMGMHFLPRCRLWLQDRFTWGMRRDGREVQYQTDYILGKYLRLFQDVAIRDPRHNSDHYMVLGCLREEPAKDLTDYLRKAHRFPLWPIHCDLAST